MRFIVSSVLSGLVALLATAGVAQVAPEKTGQIEVLRQPFSPHWVWVTDLILERAALVDLDHSRFLGIVNGGYGTILPLFPKRRSEIYVAATYYARRTHGERTDVLAIYDATTLRQTSEVILPAKRATNAVALAHSALADDDRFVAVFNWTTGTSLSIVDVEQRRLVGEIETPGCSLVYAAGPRRFFSLCGDGSAFVVTLNDDGTEAGRTRTEKFFDPQKDPITEKAVRAGRQWFFVSFDGIVHPVDVGGPDLGFGPTWSLFSDTERRDSWRVGGLQHLAVHAASGRLFVLVHQGAPDTHKDPGSEVWVYDTGSRQRQVRVPLVVPGVTIYSQAIEIGKDWVWPFDGLFDWLLDTFVPAGVSAINVTQDDEPLLFTVSQFTGAVGVYDARSGTFLRRVQPVGWTSDVVLAPWDGRQP